MELPSHRVGLAWMMMVMMLLMTMVIMIMILVMMMMNLPDPVCPYAKQVAIPPSNIDWTRDLPMIKLMNMSGVIYLLLSQWWWHDIDHQENEIGHLEGVECVSEDDNDDDDDDDDGDGDPTWQCICTPSH